MADPRTPRVRKPIGPHPHHRLTALRVKGIRQPGWYADGDGLYLRVTKRGGKAWVLRTLVELGRDPASGRVKSVRREIGLGSARHVDLAAARREAAQLLTVARIGRADPLAARRQGRVSGPTFEAAAKEVHKQHGAAFRNPKHRAQWLASLTAYVFPVFGSRPISAIDTADVLKALTPIWTKKPENARRLKQRIKVVLDWGKASGFRTGDNPVDGLTKVLPKGRPPASHHAALPYTQVAAFVKALRGANAGTSAKLAFEFLILTAARTGEAVGARWDEIDRRAKTWTIPAVRIKAGREHRVPLSTRALELLDQAEAIADGGGFVFPGRSSTAPLSNMVFLMLLRRLERTDITAHGFRSAFRDWAAERTHAPRAVMEAALAHVVKDRTEAAYFRSDLFAARSTLMADWAAFVTATPATVVQLHA